jgi:subtilisin family serine protease
MNSLREIRRKKNLFGAIEEKRRQRQGLEVLIGTAAGRQDELAGRLRGLGQIKHVYGSIPYLSILMDASEAGNIAAYVHSEVHRDARDNGSGGAHAGANGGAHNNARNGFGSLARSASFERSYGGLLRSIVSIDASSVYKCVPSPKQNGRLAMYDLDFEGLWNLENIGAYDAQRIASGEGVKIGIIDTGIDYTHPDLAARFGSDKGYDFVRGSNDPRDREGHGTHVAGTACSPNCGVSLDSELYGVRVLNEYGSGSESDIIAGIDYCIGKGIDVANMSLGAGDASRAFEAICAKAYDSGLILVAAAGNEEYGPEYPAAFGESVIAVAAVDSNNEHADFSNVWETNDISAPGVNIVSCLMGGGYTALDGTSMATPHVTGTVALALSMFRDEPQALDDYIADTAQELDYGGEYSNDWVFGAGLIRADRLLARIANSSAFRNNIRRRRR